LIADLRPGLYGEAPIAILEAAVHAIAPMLGRLVRRWPAMAGETAESTAPLAGHRVPGRVRGDAARFDALLAGLGQACTGAGTPRDFLLAVSYTLQALLPHDIIELLVPDATGERHYRLGSHGFGPLWSDPALVVTSDSFDPEPLFRETSTLLIADASAAAQKLGPLRGGAGESRSVIGAKLRVLERTVGYLLLGSLGEDFYEPEDRDLIDHIGALITSRVDAFVLSWHQQVLRTNLGLLRSLPVQLGKIAESLTVTPLLGEGTRVFARQVAGILPINRVEFALRLGDETRVAIIQPGDPTALADLPQAPIAGTLVGDVIRGSTPWVLTEQDLGGGPESVMVVPLRAGGVVFGAVAMTGAADVLTRADVPLAQQLADLIAPHFEVLRRAVVSQPPYAPGWKRAPRF
jgi:GAF domain-containing protein